MCICSCSEDHYIDNVSLTCYEKTHYVMMIHHSESCWVDYSAHNAILKKKF